MTQIYATTANFLGQDYSLLVADRRVSTCMTIFNITCRGSEDKDSDETGKIQRAGHIAYAFSGTAVPGSFENLTGRLKNGTWEESLQAVQAHFEYLAKSTGESFRVVAAGFNHAPRIISFEVSPEETRFRKPKKIVYANEPSEYRKITLKHYMSPRGTNFEKDALLDGRYCPKLDFAIDALRESVLEDRDKKGYGISRNVNIGLVSQSGVVEFDDYVSFPDSWIKEGRGGYETLPFSKVAGNFIEQSKRRILDAPAIEDANLFYRVALSGLRWIVKESITLDGYKKFFSNGWEEDAIKTELLFRGAGAPRGLLSRGDLEERLRLVGMTAEPILQESA